MRVADDPSGHLRRAGGIGGPPGASGRKLGGDDEPAGGDQPLQEPAAADVFDDCVSLGHVTLLWRPP